MVGRLKHPNLRICMRNIHNQAVRNIILQLKIGTTHRCQMRTIP